jgi:hypothetical protein
MLSLITNNTPQILPKNPRNALVNVKRKEWEQYYSQAYQAHRAKKITLAIDYFTKSLSISETLIDYFFDDYPANSGIAMMYSSSHNLSACLNIQHQALEAKRVLLAFHDRLIDILCNTFKPKPLRLEALAYLDKSLFSVTSQLAYINEVENIHAIILKTETVASNTAQKIFTAGKI